MKSIMDEKGNIYSTIKNRDHLDKMYLVICNLKDKWIAKDISTFNDKEERIYKDICFVELKYNVLIKLDPDIVYPYQVNFHETAMEIVEGTIMSILLDEDRLKNIPPPLKINLNDPLMNK
jgi:hypothetical protein